MSKEARVYSYRWLILLAFMFLNLTIQIQWLTHAPVARAAEHFYAGQFQPNSLVNVDFLAMIYMLVYIVMSIPASYVIDSYGIRIGVGIGALLAGVCGLLKGIWADHFQAVLWTQAGLAVAQPFILNAVTAITMRWFALRERAMAAGLASLAQYLGIIVAMGVIPLLVVTDPGQGNYGEGIHFMLWLFGLITLASAVFALLVLRNDPPTPPDGVVVERYPFFAGLNHILRHRDMLIMILLFFIGLGIFNAVSSMVDSIAEYIGVEDSDGLIGVAMLAGGVLGAVLLPILSDKTHRRKIFLVICMGGMIPGLFLLTFAGGLTDHIPAAYALAITGAALLGFFIMSAGPIGFQYAAEVSAPAPESTSQGLLLLSGQITGMIFVAGMSIHGNRYLGTFLIAFFVLSLVLLGTVLLLRESPAMRAPEESSALPDRIKSDQGEQHESTDEKKEE